MERSMYQITLKHWLTRESTTHELGETIGKAKEQLKFLRKRYSKWFWIKATPIHC